MNQPEFASLSSAGDIIRLTLRRPPLNFLNRQMLQQMQGKLESLGDAPDGCMLVVDSDGPAFCAGLDMTEQTRDGVFLLLDQYHNFMHSLCTFPRPTVAAVRGVALGAGNELAACCDFVIASSQATFGQPEIKVAGIPTLAPLLLPQRIGMQRTMQMILTGAPVAAGEAERIGLIYRAVPDDGMEPAIEELALHFRSTSKPVLEIALQAARGARTRELESNLRSAQSLYLNDLMDLEDPMEGLQAFMEKRSPRWKHR
jgi:cyclohexa-1,5-dienecarbonyl-CoA hydratase